MITIKERFNISEQKLQFIIKDFLDHLNACDISLKDSRDNHCFSDEFIIENYLQTFN